MPLLRLFWAVNLPPGVRAILAGVQSELMKAHADAKWVEKNNLHLTVQFLGDVPDEQVPALITAAKSAVAPGLFPVELAGLGAFPDTSRPRVVWAGVQGGQERLFALYRQVSQAMSTLGFTPRGRFSPHLTLARLRSSRGTAELMRLAAQRSGEYFGTFKVTSVDLMQSVLSRYGPSYTLLAAVKL